MCENCKHKKQLHAIEEAILWLTGEPTSMILTRFLCKVRPYWMDPPPSHNNLLYLSTDAKEYAIAFAHTHGALYVGGKLVDECKFCGLDLRDFVHSKTAKAERERRRVAALEKILS